MAIYLILAMTMPLGNDFLWNPPALDDFLIFSTYTCWHFPATFNIFFRCAQVFCKLPGRKLLFALVRAKGGGCRRCRRGPGHDPCLQLFSWELSNVKFILNKLKICFGLHQNQFLIIRVVSFFGQPASQPACLFFAKHFIYA